MAAGFAVPAGFAVTASAYRHFETRAGIGPELRSRSAAPALADLFGVTQAAASCRALVEAATLPGDLAGQLGDAYAELAAISDSAAAVRSSALSEDGAGASFAGLYESFLNIQGVPAVTEAVRSCYASLWSERAIRYRAARNIEDDAMALIVMALVPSDTSGVAFTAHPVTGERDRVLINASWGLGEAVVSGLVTPDSFVVTKEPLTIVEQGIGDKTIAIRPHPNGHGTIEQPLADERRLAPSLTDAEALAVAKLATAVERYYSTPQDVEWALHQGNLYLLQARPITTL
jgi:pyruvate,water dikinase